MGWRLKVKDNKYRIWSTFSDSYLTPWLSKKDLLLEVLKYRDTQFKEKSIEEYYRFPHMWSVKGENKILNNQEGEQAYRDWLDKLHKAPDGKYRAFVNREYGRIMKELEE